MLRLSKTTDYGLLILRSMLAANGRLMSAREIADHVQVGLPMVSKVLKSLVNASLVSSVRGSAGGYQLHGRPEQINLSQIICALEGDLAITECSGSTQGCALHHGCAMKPNWQVVNEVIHRVLSNLTLAQMCNNISADELLRTMTECIEA